MTLPTTFTPFDARWQSRRDATSDPVSARQTEESKPMAFTVDGRQRSYSKFKRAESIEFRFIYFALLAVFLVAATIERVTGLATLRRGAGAKKVSILEQAKSAANTCAAYAFMG